MEFGRALEGGHCRGSQSRAPGTAGCERGQLAVQTSRPLTCLPNEVNLRPMTMTTETILTLTPRAAAEVKDILAKSENAGKHYRVFVEQGGCSGMQYGMVFDEPRDGDFSSEQLGVTVLVDGVSAQYLRGTVVDFSDELTGGGFKITNPNAKESCGCGRSFNA